MNFNTISDKLAGKKTTPTHLNLGVTVNPQPDGSVTITIPKDITADYIYESPVKETEKDGKKKITGGNPMIYCLPQSPDPKVKRVLIPVTVTQGDTTKTLLMGMSGFSLLVKDIADEN